MSKNIFVYVLSKAISNKERKMPMSEYLLLSTVLKEAINIRPDSLAIPSSKTVLTVSKFLEKYGEEGYSKLEKFIDDNFIVSEDNIEFLKKLKDYLELTMTKGAVND